MKTTLLFSLLFLSSLSYAEGPKKKITYTPGVPAEEFQECKKEDTDCHTESCPIMIARELNAYPHSVHCYKVYRKGKFAFYEVVVGMNADGSGAFSMRLK